MFLIACHQVVRFRGIGTFEKHIVIGVAGHFKATGRSDDMTVILDKLQQLLTKPLADMQLRT